MNNREVLAQLIDTLLTVVIHEPSTLDVSVARGDLFRLKDAVIDSRASHDSISSPPKKVEITPVPSDDRGAITIPHSKVSAAQDKETPEMTDPADAYWLLSRAKKIIDGIGCVESAEEVRQAKKWLKDYEDHLAIPKENLPEKDS